MIGTYFEARHFDLPQQIQLIVEEQQSDIAEHSEMIGHVIGLDVPDRRRLQNVFADRVQFIIEPFEEKLGTFFQGRRQPMRRRRKSGRRAYLVSVEDRRMARGDALRPVATDVDRSKDFVE